MRPLAGAGSSRIAVSAARFLRCQCQHTASPARDVWQAPGKRESHSHCLSHAGSKCGLAEPIGTLSGKRVLEIIEAMKLVIEPRG